MLDRKSHDDHNLTFSISISVGLCALPFGDFVGDFASGDFGAGGDNFTLSGLSEEASVFELQTSLKRYLERRDWL